MLPRPISQPKQLVVEGADAQRFFEAFMKAEGVLNVQVQNFGGNAELPGALPALTKLSGFAEVVSLAVIRDAERDPAAAFQSVCTTLEKAGLPRPGRAGEFASGRPGIGVFILPDAKSAGMLESLCLLSVAADPALPCVHELFGCLERAGVTAPTKMEKARVRTFLASRPKPGLRLGEAAEAGIWPWNHPALDEVRQFLRAL